MCGEEICTRKTIDRVNLGPFLNISEGLQKLIYVQIKYLGV